MGSNNSSPNMTQYLQPGVSLGSSSNMGQYLQPTSSPGLSFNNSDNSPDTDSSRGESKLSALNRKLAESRARLAAQPRLPSFDSSANRALARKRAASTVNPKYQDNLTRYLKNKKMKISQREELADFEKKNIQDELQQVLEDSMLGRERTTEDTEKQLGDINATENSWQQQEGRQFDQARMALLGDVADAGLSESGLGRGTVQNAITDRNLASVDQVREYDTNRRDAEIFKTRSLADLDTIDTREKGSAKSRTKQEDISLSQYIDQAGADEETFRFRNESDRLSELYNRTDSAYSKIIADKIEALTGSGARNQDVSLFRQVYG